MSFLKVVCTPKYPMHACLSDLDNGLGVASNMTIYSYKIPACLAIC